MSEQFFKFPRTPHLLWPLDRPPKDDRVLDPESTHDFLSGVVTVEEKVDGANLGLSLGDDGEIRAQNRGSWLERGVHPQFQPMWSWIAQRKSVLQDVLQDQRILFGEWCYAVHSVEYNKLPDWFLAFDVFDVDAAKFWSSRRRDALLESTGICRVPHIYTGRITLKDLQKMMAEEQSRYTDGPLEGLYVRRESADWLEQRAKLVRPEFLMMIEGHWSARSLERNHLIRH